MKLALLILMVALSQSIAQPIPKINPQIKVHYKVGYTYEPFEYRTRWNARTQYIDDLLGYRINQNAEACLMDQPYYDYLRTYKVGVISFWPSGEYLGKFSQGLINSYRYSHDTDYLIQVRKIIDTWIDAQAQDGHLGTNRSVGYKLGDRWVGWAAWEHKYTLLGLLEYYDASRTRRLPMGEQRALEAAIKIGDLLCHTYGDQPGQLDLMETYNAGMAGGSLLEAMVYLYQYTSDEKYLDFCHYILGAFEQDNGPKIISELTERSGKVNRVGTGKYRENGKGYELLSCLIGILRMYQLTGEKTYLRAAQIAWQDILEHRLYITGTATVDERFARDNFLPADELDEFQYEDFPDEPARRISMGEGCVTAHWIYLSRILYQLTGELKYVEEIEKSVYNHLLGSQHPQTGQQCYYLALIGDKDFEEYSPYNGKPPCCVSSVSRCIARIPESLWTKSTENGCALLIYSSGKTQGLVKTEDEAEVMVELEVESDLYDHGQAIITVQPRDTAQFTLSLRVPEWANTFEATLDGKSYSGEAGKFIHLNQEWKGKQKIEINVTGVEKVIEGGPSYQGHYAFKHGPFVLALDQSLNPNIDIDKVTLSNPTELVLSPAENALPEGWVGNLSFSVPTSDGKELILVPFMDAGQNGDKYRVWIPGQ